MTMNLLWWFMATTAAVVIATEDCTMDRNDRVFCNALNSVCVSSTDRACLALSLQNCLLQAELPFETRTSLLGYVDNYLDGISSLRTTTTDTTYVPDKVFFNTGVKFIDVILSHMATFPDENFREFLINRVKHSFETSINLAVQDVSLVTEKLEFMFANFSNNKINSDLLHRKLANLFKNDSDHYYWFIMVIDGVLSDLGVTDFDRFLPISNLSDWYKLLDESDADDASSKNVVYCHDRTDEEHIITCEKYCFDSYGGNWIIIQSRDQDREYHHPFDRSFWDYEVGFGDMDMGYWMGLGCINAITTSSKHELLVELTNANGEVAIAHYDEFSVGSKAAGYELTLGRFLGGAAGDSLSFAKGQKFAAKDHDLGRDKLGHCALINQGGWWYSPYSCDNSLNTAFSDYGFPAYRYGVRWQSFDTTSAIVKTRMMIRSSEDQQGHLVPLGAEMYTLWMVTANQGVDGTISVEIRGDQEDELDSFDHDFIMY